MLSHFRLAVIFISLSRYLDISAKTRIHKNISRLNYRAAPTDIMSETGSDDGAWDVEAYRVDYESEEHWELRKVTLATISIKAIVA